jgi:hypothetical protein
MKLPRSSRSNLYSLAVPTGVDTASLWRDLRRRPRRLGVAPGRDWVAGRYLRPRRSPRRSLRLLRGCRLLTLPQEEDLRRAARVRHLHKPGCEFGGRWVVSKMVVLRNRRFLLSAAACRQLTNRPEDSSRIQKEERSKKHQRERDEGHPVMPSLDHGSTDKRDDSDRQQRDRSTPWVRTSPAHPCAGAGDGDRHKSDERSCNRHNQPSCAVSHYTLSRR